MNSILNWYRNRAGVRGDRTKPVRPVTQYSDLPVLFDTEPDTNGQAQVYIRMHAYPIEEGKHTVEKVIMLYMDNVVALRDACQEYLDALMEVANEEV